jgi:hypothetical protein
MDYCLISCIIFPSLFKCTEVWRGTTCHVDALKHSGTNVYHVLYSIQNATFCRRMCVCVCVCVCVSYDIQNSTLFFFKQHESLRLCNVNVVGFCEVGSELVCCCCWFVVVDIFILTLCLEGLSVCDDRECYTSKTWNLTRLQFIMNQSTVKCSYNYIGLCETSSVTSGKLLCQFRTVSRNIILFD